MWRVYVTRENERIPWAQITTWCHEDPGAAVAQALTFVATVRTVQPTLIAIAKARARADPEKWSFHIAAEPGKEPLTYTLRRVHAGHT